ncbi:hypothetical protein JCM11251_005693 [Rhodosporidiobolus azoricus]
MAPLRSLHLQPPATSPPSSTSSSYSSHSPQPSFHAAAAVAAMSTTPPLHKRLPHSRHASRERDTGPSESVLTFQSAAPLAEGPIYANVDHLYKRKAHAKLLVLAVILLGVFFLNASWLFGSFFHLPARVSNLHVAVVDLDGGAIGSALTTAAKALSGQRGTPSFDILDAGSNPAAEVQRKVFDGEYWGAIYATSGASDRFTSAVTSEAAASSYNASQALVYTGLEVRYNTVWGKYIYPALLKVVEGTQLAFADTAVPPLLSTSTTYGSSAAKVLAQPIGSTYVNLTPFGFGTRALLNTAGFVFPILLIAFFLAAKHAVFSTHGYYRNLSYRSHVRLNLTLGLLWPFVTSLVTACWYLMFDEDYIIGVKSFFALWALLFVYCMIYYALLESLYCVAPVSSIPLIVFTLLVLSVASTSHPLSLQPAFYKLQYAFPSHATWETAITIFGHGAVKTLRYNLPILAAWFVATIAVLHLALKKREKDGLTPVVGAAVLPVKIET